MNNNSAVKIDEKLFKGALDAYKKVFAKKQWPDEKYKWIAVQHFQNHWDLDAADFYEMLNRSLEKTGNLMASMNSYPRRMVLEFTQKEPQKVRKMFRELFDETQDVVKRIIKFKTTIEDLRVKCRPDAKNHYHDENTIVKYLWLKYPNKYYIYKIRELRAVADKLSVGLEFKQGRFAENWPKFMALYDAIREALSRDDELRQLLKMEVSADRHCFKDESLCTMTVDFGFFISRSWNKENPEVVMSAAPRYAKDDFLNEFNIFSCLR